MAYATFADLPAEMVGNVFAFIRSKSDQRSVCLVCPTFRDHMNPIMWEKLEIKLGTASPESLATLANPRSAFTQHIRELRVLDAVESAEVEARVISAVAVIPRDRLRGLCCCCYLNALTVQTLLQSQRKIEILELCTPFTIPGLLGLPKFDSKEYHAWTTSTLPDVAETLLYIAPYNIPEERVLKNLIAVSENHPKMETLTLISMSVSGNRGTSLSGIFTHNHKLPLFSNLSSLSLYQLRLVTTKDQAISKSIDLCKLRFLQIEGCNYIVPFLEALSSCYALGTGKLEELYIVLPYQLEEPQISVKAIEKLLMTSPKLEALQLDFSRHGIVAKDCILAHRQKLQCLMIGTGVSEVRSYLSITEMTVVLRACVHLKYLAVNMPAVNLGPVTKLGAQFYPEGEFADMLALVSTHPTLCAYRILNLPTIDFDNDDAGDTVPANRHVYFCQVLMQNLANQIFRFMADRGSHLRVLSIKPSCDDVRADGKGLDVDTNGHQWPEYNYARGCSTGIMGTNFVIAHPLRKVLEDFPELESFISYNWGNGD